MHRPNVTTKAADTLTTYERAVDISRDYLGPAGERFMRKQIQTHLGKEPEELARKDIVQLATWVKATFVLLTDDRELIDTFSKRLLQLASKSVDNNPR